jgi:DNA-binding response OmpR family regulator
MTPDVVLVDRRLGDIDGLDVVRDAREASPATRFVMVSACSETRDIVTAIRRGACDYVTKPFQPEEIHSAVNRALQEPEHTSGDRHGRSSSFCARRRRRDGWCD